MIYFEHSIKFTKTMNDYAESKNTSPEMITESS